MDEYKVKITPQANVQMLEIFSYISNTLKEPVAASRFLDEIEKRSSYNRSNLRQKRSERTIKTN